MTKAPDLNPKRTRWFTRLLRIGAWGLTALVLLILARGYFAFRDRNPGYAVNLNIDPAKSAAEPRPLRVGFARAKINPDLSNPKRPVWVAGFDQNRAATGIHDDLWAVGCVVDDGWTRVGVVAIDAIGFFHDDVVEVRRRLAESLKLDYTLVCSTHNHSTPDLMGLWGPDFLHSGVQPEYREKVVAACVEVLNGAVTALEPARVAFHEIRTEPKELMADTRKPEVYDADIRVMHFAAADSTRTLGSLVSWGNHPETVWSRNTEITADYCGYLRDALERGAAGDGAAGLKGLGGIHMFVNGAVGGLMSTTPSVTVKDPLTCQDMQKPSHEKARAVGLQVAKRVLDRIGEGPGTGFLERLAIGVKAKTFNVALENKVFLLAGYLGLLERGHAGWQKLRTEVALITLGDASIACVPGEIYPEIVNGGIEKPAGADFDIEPVEVPPIREMMPGRVKFVFGLANDEIGYLIPKTEWNRKPPHIYGASRAPYGEINSVGPNGAGAVHAALKELCQGTRAMSKQDLWMQAPRAAGVSFAMAAGTAEKREPNAAGPATAPTSPPDPYIWLEDVGGEKALAWVKEQNAQSTKELEASAEFEATRQRLLAILDSKEKIPYVSKHGKFLYNFWRDEKNVRGLFRRTTLEEYRKASPAWESVLDLDQLAEREKENWVWKGYQVLRPSHERCLISLSRGGGDAVVIREFDLGTKDFVPGGFVVPEAKSQVAWRDRDRLYIGTDFGPGSLTSSGYPRLVKEWKRGAPLAEAKLVFEGQEGDVAVGADVAHDHGRVYEWIERGVTFFTSHQYLLRGDVWMKLDKPDDANASTFGEQLLLRLRSDWTVGGKTFPAGALLAIDLERFVEGARDFGVLFQPTERKSLAGWSDTKNYLLVNELENVRNRPYVLERKDGKWTRTAMEAPAFGSIGVSGLDPDESDEYFMTVADYLTPSSLYLGTVGKPGREKLKSLPAFFNAEGLEISQYEAISKDGTRVPYFQVSRKGMALDGRNPTLLYGYGGFEISMVPSYSAGVGASWLEKGGVYAVANIRGGGEFGPKWHNAARKENRQRAYDDFISVAEHLVSRKVTSPRHLGIQGGSNGGLLMGVMFTQRPDLFRAVVCQVPLLDMRRFNQLLAGASWMDEYGNPDVPAEWGYISKYSPYQNVVQGRNYPRVLFATSTRDDRVHPGHARKMVARMKEQGHDVLYYENIEGGHGGAANNKQSAFMSALAYTFLLKELKGQ